MKKVSLAFFKKKKSQSFTQKLIRPVPLAVVVVLVTAVLLRVKLLALVPFGNFEEPHRIGSATVDEIKNDILFGPIKAIQIIILKLTENDAYIRLASVIVGIIAALLLYLLLRKWHTPRVSLLTTLMFVTSSWFLHAGRLASSDVLYLCSVPALLLSCLWFLSKKHDMRLPAAATLIGLTLYLPGSWLFILAGGIFFRKIIIKTIKEIPRKLQIISGAAFTLTILPLLASIAMRPGQILLWLGYDRTQPLSLRILGDRILDIPQHLFISGPDESAKWLVGTPILDVFSIAMLILGIYAYRAGYYPIREKLVFGTAIIALICVGFGNMATLSLLIPVIYILIANGLAYMLQSWFTVFPRNPVARPLGIAILSLAVIISCSYQLQRYFVAWPNVEATKPALISDEE